METEILKLKAPKYVFSTLLCLSIITVNNNALAMSKEELCELPIFKTWNKQQANRLWSPSNETLLAERSGKLFTYNCFTFEDIDRFFESHEDRIENAHFNPILEIKGQTVTVASGDDDDC
ncbi:MAG: hypothetical protein U9N50_14235 [Pseudomonadota bacterium]|nr:hypothetical protein [Pseudomonadota bacterium]